MPQFIPPPASLMRNEPRRDLRRDVIDPFQQALLAFATLSQQKEQTDYQRTRQDRIDKLEYGDPAAMPDPSFPSDAPLSPGGMAGQGMSKRLNMFQRKSGMQPSYGGGVQPYSTPESIQANPMGAIKALGTKRMAAYAPILKRTQTEPMTPYEQESLDLRRQDLNSRQTEEQKLKARNQAKLDKERPKATASLSNTLREYDNMIAEAEAIKNDPGVEMATGASSFMGRLPGALSLGAKNPRARLETLKAKTLLNVLASLKELSATGASGFGQLSNIEGENLRNSISTLDPELGTQDFKDSIDRFIKEMRTRKGVLQGTFEDTYGGSVGGFGGAGTPPPAGGNGGASLMTATNPSTGEKIQSRDGGQTWEPMR